MKKQLTFLKTALFIFCFGMICTTSLNAQKYSYKPLALEGVHWWVGLTSTNFPPWEPTDLYQYVIRGDSVIDDISYKKVYFRELTDLPPILIEYQLLSRLVRDDTINKKVYAIYLDYPNWDCTENEEILLYDYNLSVGDTMNTCLIHTGPGIIQSIEYEFIYGEERQILNEFNGKFIEGIGSEFGVFEWGLGSKENTTREKGWCYQLGDYCLGTDEECGCQWVGIEEQKALPKIRVFPNPIINNKITLVAQIPIPHNVEVKLFDISGSLVHTQTIGSLNTATDVYLPDHLSAGTSPLLLWVGNHQEIFFTELLMR